MNQSIVTEFQQDGQFSPTIRSQSPCMRSQDNDGEDIYISKLDAKVKQLKATIRKNKPLIEQMKTQRKFLKKICQKQRQKIEGAKLQLLRSQYQNEMEQLRRQKHKLEDMMEVIHEQSSMKAQQFVEAKEQIQRNGTELENALEEVRKENQMYQQIIIAKTKEIQLKNCQRALLSVEIKGKQNIEKKYKQVTNQIQMLEAECRR